jgi:uncharacterized protein YaaW (UPF0174 family)
VNSHSLPLNAIENVAGEVWDLDELRVALELATDEELQALTEILFRRKFNPLDYMCTPEPIEVQSRDREDWIEAILERFQFLAADGMTILRGKTEEVSYRQVLLQVCRYLKIPCTPSFSVEQLEVEIFLHLLQRAWQKLPQAEQTSLNNQLRQAISETELSQHLPATGANDPTRLLLSGGAVAVSSVLRPLLLQTLARQYAFHAATYQVASQAASQAITQASGLMATQFQGRVAMQTASRAMALSAARYGAVRSVFALLGPMMWACFFADLGWRAIATNYSRVIPVIFTLAQIRLTRTACYELA